MGGPESQATNLARPLDYGANSAATLLGGGSCQELLADNIGSVASQEHRKEISDKFHTNIKLAEAKRDDYSENFVTEAMIIYGRILSVPSVAQIIVEQEKRDG